MSYMESLRNTVKNWMSEDNSDEWLFENFRQTVIGKLESSDAFNYINETIPILLDDKNYDIWTELFETVISLARRSNTTEIPNSIHSNWETIKKLSVQHSDYARNKLEELATYYRIPL